MMGESEFTNHCLMKNPFKLLLVLGSAVTLSIFVAGCESDGDDDHDHDHHHGRAATTTTTTVEETRVVPATTQQTRVERY